jgi:uncharacterized protein YecE (DUF72 family)
MKATTFGRVTKVWNRIVVDRAAEMTSWVDACKKIQRRGVTIYGYFNSHYAGFGPGSVRLFRDMCTKNGLEIPCRLNLSSSERYSTETTVVR